jgi:hypothetical protein
MGNECYRCESNLTPEVTYTVINGRGQAVGDMCEPCAESDFDRYQESRV